MWRLPSSGTACAVVLSMLALGARTVSAQLPQELNLIDSPTAGILPHGGYMFSGSIGPRSSLLFGVRIGFHDRLMLGASYGLQEFVGRGDIEANDKPGFEVRLRIIEEGIAGPALAVGIDTQGEDTYIESADRYEIKSRGFYAVTSKNYHLLGDIGFHAGVNYSLEDEDESGVNAFGGFSFEVLEGFSLLLDYNAAIDDNDTAVPTHRTRGRGYLDAGVRFDYMENLRIKIHFKDLLGNYEYEKGVARTVEIFYFNYF